MCALSKQVAELGANIVAVGNGKPWQAAAFRDEAGVRFELYTDPHLLAFHASGLRRSWLHALHPGVFFAVWRARRGNHRQAALQGDPWQLGGMLLFDPSGRLRWLHRSRFPGDDAKPADIVAQLRALAP